MPTTRFSGVFLGYKRWGGGGGLGGVAVTIIDTFIRGVTSYVTGRRTTVKLENYRHKMEAEHRKWVSIGYPKESVTVIRAISKKIIKHCIPRKTPKLRFFDFMELQIDGWDNIIAFMCIPQNTIYLNPRYLPQMNFNNLWGILIHEIGHYYGLKHSDHDMSPYMVINNEDRSI